MDEYYPLFGKLLDIFVVDCTQVYFQVQVLETLEFNHHYHCFVVQMSSVKCIVKHKDILSYLPHQFRTMPTCNSITHCIVLKHHFTSCV